MQNTKWKCKMLRTELHPHLVPFWEKRQRRIKISGWMWYTLTLLRTQSTWTNHNRACWISIQMDLISSQSYTMGVKKWAIFEDTMNPLVNLPSLSVFQSREGHKLLSPPSWGAQWVGGCFLADLEGPGALLRWLLHLDACAVASFYAATRSGFIFIWSLSVTFLHLPDSVKGLCFIDKSWRVDGHYQETRGSWRNG